MKCLSKCEQCHKRAPLIYKRSYEHKYAGKITSQKEVCRKCAKGFKEALAIDREAN